MEYAKPKILAGLNAITEIQQVDTADLTKAAGQYLDHLMPPISCTVSAYEADE